MRSPPRAIARAASGFLLLLPLLMGCDHDVECTSEVTAGEGTYRGSAKGPHEAPSVSREAVRDACRQMCAATKAAMVDGCASRCEVDVDAGKIGAKTTCN